MNVPPVKRFLQQLKKRKVIRVGIAYIIAGWVMMQVGEVTFEALSFPPWTLTLLIVIILLGFPIALVLAWAFEITSEGVQKDSVGLEPGAVKPPPEMNSTAPSIAVLPFDDMSELGDQTYFCEGIAEEILNALCKVANLRVAARVMSFRFDGKNADVKEIGRKLQVQTVLEGSVRKSGERLRITAQLVKTSDGYHLWSRQYDRRLQDIFEIQEEIADSIASALSVTLKRKTPSEQQAVDPKAYDLFLRGLCFFAKQNIQDTVYARQMFLRALEVDPQFGRGWAVLAYTYGFEYLYFNATEVNREEALRTSRKAQELAPDLAESHVSAGIARCMMQDYEKAEAEFEKAVELDPENFDAWYFFARDKVHEGDIKRAVKLFERASKVRPEDYQSVLLQSQLWHSLGDTKREMETARRGIKRARAMLELNPDDNRAYNTGAFALLRLGEREEAEKWMKSSVDKAPLDSIVHYNAACFHALAGNLEMSLDCLENCFFKVGNLNREWLLHDSDLDNVREHPRFAKILAAFS
ncbi:MAG: tetratricopeptide repeat protein [Lysobacterales bacterium]